MCHSSIINIINILSTKYNLTKIRLLTIKHIQVQLIGLYTYLT